MRVGGNSFHDAFSRKKNWIELWIRSLLKTIGSGGNREGGNGGRKSENVEGGGGLAFPLVGLDRELIFTHGLNVSLDSCQN